MRSRPVITRIVALLLIVVFSQKSGAGLFLHNLLHTSAGAAAAAKPGDVMTHQVTYACSCIDDLMMPFEEAAPALQSEIHVVYAPVATTLIEEVSLFSVTGTFLRGPPAYML